MKKYQESVARGEHLFDHLISSTEPSCLQPLHFCVEYLLRILFACFVAFVHFCVDCFASKFELLPSNHAMSWVIHIHVLVSELG